MTRLPTGEQFRIAFGPYAAVITEVGSTLRSFTFNDAEVLWTFQEDEAPRGSMGRQLVPWPNRIRDGRYLLDGVEHQLPITEVARHTALHGLDESATWTLVDHEEASVTLSTTIYPQRGWDAIIDVQITHSLDEEGLKVEVQASNAGHTRAPFGYGAHPYVAADLSSASLLLPFSQELSVDAERLLPIELGPVSATHDFAGIRGIGDTEFDSAFAGPIGPWQVTLTTADRDITFWADETVEWAQIFTPPTRDALAIEPMTCGPDAFNEGPTHDSLTILNPGESTTTLWGIRVS